MPWFFLATGVLLGLLIGSFLNVVIHRGPAMWKLVDDEKWRGNLSYPRSYCPACHTPIRSWRLVPVFSYLALGGRCANCGARIPFRYPLVELLGAAGGVCAVAFWGVSPAAIAAAAFFWMLIALAFIDLETGYLPDALTIPLALTGFIANSIGMFAPILDAVIGAVAGYAVFQAVAYAFKKIRGVEGLGAGDAKLLGALGAWLGWQALAPVVFLAAVLALIAIGFVNLRGGNIGPKTPAPFGPALAAAGAAVMIAGAGGWLDPLLRMS